MPIPGSEPRRSEVDAIRKDWGSLRDKMAHLCTKAAVAIRNGNADTMKAALSEIQEIARKASDYGR